MIKFLFIIKLCLFCIGVLGQTPRPTGFPAQRTTLWHEFGYVQGDSAIIVAVRDTSWRPRFCGTMIVWPNAGVDTAFWFWDCARWKRIGSGNSEISISEGYGITTTPNPITGAGIVETDTLEVSTPIATLDTALNVLIRGIVVVDTIQLIHSGNSASTYQNDKLIDSKLLYVCIESYPVGFLTRSNSVYMSFDPSTGIITFTNGRLYNDDMLYILYRTAAIFLVDGNGRPVIDSNGNYVIEN